METVKLDIHSDIIEKSKEGNNKAQYRLYQLYSQAMFNTCLRMMHSREETHGATAST